VERVAVGTVQAEFRAELAELEQNVEAIEASAAPDLVRTTESVAERPERAKPDLSPRAALLAAWDAVEAELLAIALLTPNLNVLELSPPSALATALAIRDVIPHAVADAIDSTFTLRDLTVEWGMRIADEDARSLTHLVKRVRDLLYRDRRRLEDAADYASRNEPSDPTTQ
jgi:hypothetical protein